MNQQNPLATKGFTLIELLVVISIIAVLMGLLLPAATGAMDAAKKAQAKNDIVGICNAIRNFNTEYGRFPAVSTDGKMDSSNKDMIVVLAAVEATPTHNPRKIVFLEPPAAKKIGTSTFVSGASQDTNWEYKDPWGENYHIRFDHDYNNEVENFYTSNAGPNPLRTQVIARSIGKNKETDSNKKSSKSADDIISWQ